MSHEDDYTHDRKARYTASTDPAKQEAQRELAARLTVAECVAEEDIFEQYPLPERKPGLTEQEYLDSVEPPPPVNEATIRRECSLSRGEWDHIKFLKLFRQRYLLRGCDLWTYFSIPVINQARSFLLRTYRSPADLRREKEELARAKKAAWEASRTFQKSAEQRAAISARTKAAWERRKAQGAGRIGSAVAIIEPELGPYQDSPVQDDP